MPDRNHVLGDEVSIAPKYAKLLFTSFLILHQQGVEYNNWTLIKGASRTVRDEEEKESVNYLSLSGPTLIIFRH